MLFGDYPSVMKKNVGSRLPSFREVQSEAIRGTLDFIGINHYLSLYVNDHPLEKGIRDFVLDAAADYRGKTICHSIQDYAFTACNSLDTSLGLLIHLSSVTYTQYSAYTMAYENSTWCHMDQIICLCF